MAIGLVHREPSPDITVFYRSQPRPLPRKSLHFSQTHSYLWSGISTVTTEMSGYLPRELLIDGVILRANFDFLVKGTDLSVYTFTSFHFADSQFLQMGVGSLTMGYNNNRGFVHLGYSKQGNLDMATVFFDGTIPEAERGLTCFALGLENAPVVIAGRIPSIDDIANQELIDLINPGVKIGPLGFAEFKVDLPSAGNVAYYGCSAYTGSHDATFIVIKVIGVPIYM